ncbi:MAG: hypothetical protein U9O94_00785 [Nanoarchaeota archaeon]|nr:hypothetical protein [Nanoarchaeota archaeon]
MNKENEIDARTFTISKCPVNIYDEFVDFAKKETGNNYAMAIRLLIERAKNSEKAVLMMSEIQNIRNDLVNHQ